MPPKAGAVQADVIDTETDVSFSERHFLRYAIEAVGVMAVSIGMLAVATFFAGMLWSAFVAEMWKPFFQTQYVALIGIPSAVITSIGLVQFFGVIHGPIQFSIGSVKFSGATGPVILWIFSFLSLVFGTKLLWAQ